MSIQLYPDQKEFYKNIAEGVAARKREIACAATGFGKSKVFITIALNALQKRTVLVVTESDKIYRQLDAEIPGGVNINSTAKLTYIQPGRLYIAMAQTLARRPKLISQFSMMGEGLLTINDEAHIGTATKLLLQLPQSLLIGFTATPAMKWAKHLPLLYNGITVGSQPEWLVDNGRLMPYTHAQVIPSGISTLKIGSNGDFTEESQERIFDTPDAHRFALQYLDESPYKRCMIFCASIKSAESLAAYLSEQGRANCVQHSRYDIRSEAKQSYDLGQFHDLGSPVTICISVASMNKGYDFPPVDLIFLYMATTSLPRYLQSIGRGSRMSTATGKTGFRVVDFGGNGKRHGRWDYNHPWAEMWNKIPKKREGVAPVKICPKCNYMLRPTAMECPNCGHVFVKQAVEQLDGVRTVMLEKPKYGKKLSELTAIELAKWSKENDKLNFAIRVAKARSISDPEFLTIFGMAKGYKLGWAEHHRAKVGEKVFYTNKLV